MKEKQIENDKITKTDFVFIIGLAIFAVLTFIGLSLDYDVVWSTIILIGCIGICIMTTFGLKKIKTTENNFKTWRIVEIFALLACIFLYIYVLNTPMNRGLNTYFNKKNLQEKAQTELTNIKNVFVDYEKKEKHDIEATITSLKAAKGYTTDTKHYFGDDIRFDDDIKEYIDFFINDEIPGEITQKKINDYSILLYDVFLDSSYYEYKGGITDKVESMEKAVSEWNLLDIISINNFAKDLDNLFKNVEQELNKRSGKRHEKGPYKFTIKGKEEKYFVLNELLECGGYEVKEKGSYSKLLNNVTDGHQFNFICIITTIMVLFPYLMANRSTKVEIKRMYDKNREDLGCSDL